MLGPVHPCLGLWHFDTRLTRSKRLVVRARRWEGHARYLLDSINLHMDITTFYATIIIYDCYIWLQSTLGTVYKSHCFRADVTLWIHDLSHHLWGSQLSQCAALGAFDVAISFGGRIWSVSPFIVWKISFQWAWKQLLSRWWYDDSWRFISMASFLFIYCSITLSWFHSSLKCDRTCLDIGPKMEQIFVKESRQCFPHGNGF